MEVFKTQQEGFAVIRKQTLTRFVPAMLFGLIVVLVVNYGDGSDVRTALFVLPVMLAAVGISIYRGLRNRKRLYDSFTIEIDEDTVVRKQDDTPDLSLNRLEISAISKDATGVITIRGMSAEDIIQIPAGMERMAELEAKLLQFLPFSEESERSLLERFRWVTGVAAIVLMAVIRFVENKIAVVASGVLLISLLVWGVLKTYRNKNLPEQYKRTIWIMPLLIAAVIVAILAKLGVFNFRWSREIDF
ncbi:MAG: hypothetical protein J7623_23735 [Chitinophaga sp.]|uniref:hypothetical protein n=1 Tax=Chitinophaga sp. TaxID=1869181 RepID=UPI001B148EF2|nr:hypothetical protein [Chitinophaga sp.]MBO9731673.1 hypothetical protein [Chitinophaga sp.]